MSARLPVGGGIVGAVPKLDGGREGEVAVGT